MAVVLDTLYADTLDQVIKLVLGIEKQNENGLLYFRGETKDRGEKGMAPSVYRSEVLLKKEHEIFREMQRFNDFEFSADKTTFDKLARMQHYEAPTRMLDMSEDVLSALFFALHGSKDEPSVLYVIEVREEEVKYYDSDAVSVVSNLVKTPLVNQANEFKSKIAIHKDALQYLDCPKGFKESDSVGFLLHDIKEEKNYFQNLIVPKHLFSVFCVKPKYTNQRIHGQKGAFLLFGMNKNDVKAPISLFSNKLGRIEFNPDLSEEYHPIAKVTKIVISSEVTAEALTKLGITQPYIYPELDKVAEFLKAKY